ncbi:unnamed protein product [Cyprideis torosa]|uniref:Large subunit GTPase 1 homolog n=1 Tax=Cyprideis torosa TaxID=163714 RepID=A0A7R8ZKV0_9CRUS|nr:unnamed protein product [Cyprideis torosa]CAG0890242.1 unnamed protein product [Cyprideis torosa]
MGRKKEKNSSLGQTLIKDSHKRGARQLHPKGKGDENLLHSANLQDGADWNRLNLRSVTEAGPIEEFLAVADLADSDFTAERRNVTLVSSTTAFQQLLTERVKSEKIRRSHSSLVRIPRRPFWESNTTPDELVKLEKEAFLEWRRSLATLADEEGACLTPYEKNLEFWRQLWRVVERSDVVVQILDARNPLLFRCPDLEKYVREVKSSKMNVLLLNKADFLTYSQRRSWAEWFQSEGMKVIFYSAVSTPAPISAGEESSSVNDVSEEPLNVAETVEEDGRVSQDGDDDDWETCSSSSSEEESAGTGEKSQSKKLTFASSESVRNSAECLNPDELAVLLEGLHKGSKERPGITTIGLVGYPNVGKSSTINSLLKAKKTATSITPGKTKHFQTHFLTPSLLLCDCPGLVFPSLVSTKADLVLNGILPVDSLRDHVAPTTLLIERIPSPVLEKTYGLQLPVMPSNAELMIKQPDLTSEELLNAYGAMRGYMTQRGLPDNPRSARYILKDYIKGRLLYCHAPPGVKQSEFHEVPVPKKYVEESTSQEVPPEAVPGPHVPAASGTVDFDRMFFKQLHISAHIKGKSAIGDMKECVGASAVDLSASGSTLTEKPWKKHNKKNKKEKLRRVYKHLDQ